MTNPSIEKPIIQLQVRPLLTERVKLYTSSREMRRRIVEVTILKATNNASLFLEDDVEGSVYRLLHETAVEEMNITKDMFQPGPIGHHL